MLNTITVAVYTHPTQAIDKPISNDRDKTLDDGITDKWSPSIWIEEGLVHKCKANHGIDVDNNCS